MKTLAAISFISLLAGPVASGVDESDVSFQSLSSVPPAALMALRSFPRSNLYALRARINPFLIQGDFNGDEIPDTAVLIVERTTGKQGIAVVHGGTSEVHIIGAGQNTNDRGDNYAWMDAWYSFPKGPVSPGAEEGEPGPTLLGDALMVIKTESASALIYWTGTRYGWYQQGD